MAVNKVDLTITQLLNDLNEGLTWFKKDDLGYGSIESKYGATEKQITLIRKHPKLVNAETSITIFNIIDDTNETSDKTKESLPTRTSDAIQQSMVSVDGNGSKLVGTEQSENTTEDLSAFINL